MKREPATTTLGEGQRPCLGAVDHFVLSTLENRLSGEADVGRAAVLISILSLLQACSTSVPREPIRYSIEELGAEVADRASGQGQDYRTAISITGITIPHAVGQLVNVPEDVNRSAMPDLLAMPVSTTCSRIVEAKYDLPPDTNGPSVVASLAGGLEQLSGIYLALTAARSRLAIANAGFERAKALSDPTKVKEDPQSKLAATALGLSEPSQDAFSAKQMELQKAVLDQQNAIAKVQADFQALKRTPNVVITRWSRAEESATAGGLGALLGFRDKGRQERKGFLVLGGLRTSTLVIGNDLMYRTRNAQGDGLYGSAAVFDKTYFTLFTLAAKHVAFTEEADLEQAIALSLKLEPGQLKQILGAGLQDFLLSQSLSLEAMLVRALTAGTFGSLTGASRSAYPFRFWGDAVLHASRHAEQSRTNGYTVVYVTRSNIDKVKIPEAVLSRFEKSSVYTRCSHAVPFEGPLRNIDYDSLGTKFCLPKGWNKLARVEGNPLDWEPDLGPEGKGDKTCIDLTRPVH